ncbi:tyrosine-type recombinase/integrase [Pseudoalteromonas shioyasakiensis]|uniref:tyrosine-type recombinase/integrase n=1 Tax=Pseudoalteromonas shioyasakiensis TaxID=1190813 RepID=UPI001C3D30BB|nr:integrase family protein [Pseudoalteromonas shioyasakiensis]
MKNTKKPITKAEYIKAKAVWKETKAPFSMLYIKKCVTAIQIISNFERKVALKQGIKNKPLVRLSKYEQQHNLRLVFTPKGKVIFYSNFPKKLEIRNVKLGELPELTIAKARELTQTILEGRTIFADLNTIFKEYEQNLTNRHLLAPTKFAAGSLRTYKCRVKKLKQYFNMKTRFQSITAGDLERIIDKIIASESNNQAIELFAQIRRIWKFAKNKFNNGRNPAADIDDYYVSDRVDTPRPCQAYTDLDSIAELWINLATTPCIHQKNAARFMILTGLRPINIPQMKWSWLNSITFPTLITFPSSIVGVRGEMKNQKEYRLPLTKMMRTIILEQRAWMESARPNCNQEFIFLQPRDPMKQFSKRSLDKIIKDYSPFDAVKGDIEQIVMKGSAGAFCTMCRSFFKSNTKELLVSNGYHFKHAEDLTRLALHHLRKSDDPNGLNYDKSEELYGTSTKLKFNVFKLHEVSILKRVHEFQSLELRPTAFQVNQQKIIKDKEHKKALRERIKASLVHKGAYIQFINQPFGDTGKSVKELILTKDGRTVIESYLDDIAV